MHKFIVINMLVYGVVSYYIILRRQSSFLQDIFSNKYYNSAIIYKYIGTFLFC